MTDAMRKIFDWWLVTLSFVAFVAVETLMIYAVAQYFQLF